MILPSKLKHSWKVVNFLIRFHFGNPLREYSSICPKDVPIFCVSRGSTNIVIAVIHLVDFLILIGTLKVKQAFRNKFDDKIFSITQVDHQPLFIFKFRVVIVVFNSHCLGKALLFGVIPFLFFLFGFGFGSIYNTCSLHLLLWCHMFILCVRAAWIITSSFF